MAPGVRMIEPTFSSNSLSVSSKLMALASQIFSHFRLTPLVRKRQWALSMALVFFFQIWVDGWLTKLSDPIVIYHPDQFSGIRFPFDIPIEDFGFGFAMVTLTLLTWHKLTHRRAD